MRPFTKFYGACSVLCVLAFATGAIAGELEATGTISGSVTFAGAPPKNEQWTVKKDTKVCSHSKTLDRLVVSKKGGVANAFIILKNAPSGSLGSFNAKPSIEQRNCEYFPHAQIVPAGSALTIINSDDVLHNIHGFYLANHTTAFNIAQPIQNQKTPLTLKKPGIIEVQCDAGHTWMSAYLYVADNPYVAVSADDGSFTIKDVPPGTYTIQCWHEGWNVTGTQEDRPVFSPPQTLEQTITINAGATAQAQFQFHNFERHD